MSVPTAHERRFIEALGRLAEREDRAALAALRRGLGRSPGEAPEMYRYVVPWLPESGSLWEEERWYTVAALFAFHPQPWDGPDDTRHAPRNLGASFARLAAVSESESVEARFVALLNAHPDDLDEHLRRAVALFKAHGIPVDWAQLLHDIRWWSRGDHRIQREWARAFWGAAAPDEGDGEG